MKFKRVLWCYGEPSTKTNTNYTKPNIEGIEYSHGLPENIENQGPNHKMLIIDDLMFKCYTKFGHFMENI